MERSRRGAIKKQPAQLPEAATQPVAPAECGQQGWVNSFDGRHWIHAEVRAQYSPCEREQASVFNRETLPSYGFSESRMLVGRWVRFSPPDSDWSLVG